jgi:hypothetical protein
MSIQKHIKDLIFFYVKTNYNEYLREKDIIVIPDNEIDAVINDIYEGRQSHIKDFIHESLKTLYKDKMNEYPGQQTITNILMNIFHDDKLCKNRLITEIKLHQQTVSGQRNDYGKLISKR